MLYTLYNADQPVATFTYENGVITGYTPQQEHLLPKQICHASHEGFAGWLRERAIDLNTFLHRQLANELIHEINPEALIMVNAISNPIAGASIAVAIPEMGFDVEIAFGDYLNYVCDAIYLETAVLAAINEKVVFVPATGVETTFTNKTVSFNGYQEFIYLLMNYETVMAEMFNIETKAEGNVAVVNKMVDALNITVEHSALLGDVDGDGAVTIKDAVLVLRFDAQLPDVALDLSVADVDGDGMVNITDAVWILRYDAKLVEKFPASK